MTLYLNFRSSPVAGSVVYPYLMQGDDANVTVVPPVEINRLLGGKNVLFAVHGFNVNQRSAIGSFAALDRYLNLGESDILIGVLWPGDFWVPVVNYPFEGSDAIDCGRKLADYCARYLTSIQSLSFMSHSLGARLVLEAVANLAPSRKARFVCLAAGAINRDCLETEYAAAAANALSIAILASHKDTVLKVAFSLGDPISDILHDDHRFFEKALGYDGPPPEAAPMLLGPWQIPDSYDYKHSSYLPPTDRNRWTLVADYVKRAYLGEPQASPRPFPPPPM
jgi:alpha/beta hydrolase family protein DUF900